MTTSAQLSMSPAERLLAIEEIKQVKSRYAYTADRHNWEEFALVFAPDAVFDESDFPGALQPFTREPVSSTILSYLEGFSSGTDWPIIGRDAIREQHEALNPDHKMVHHLANPIIELTSDSSANAIHRYESHMWFPAGEPVTYMHNFGVYHETYTRLEDGHWYIQTMRLERLRVECR